INKKMTVAVIDDDAAMCEMITDNVEKKFPAAELSIFNTGEEALNGLYESPDIVILDYQLDSSKPEAMNGLQVLNKLKTKFPDAPVVFLSSHDKTEIASNTIKFGAYDYIVKNETAFHKL